MDPKGQRKVLFPMKSVREKLNKFRWTTGWEGSPGRHGSGVCVRMHTCGSQGICMRGLPDRASPLRSRANGARANNSGIWRELGVGGCSPPLAGTCCGEGGARIKGQERGLLDFRSDL